MEHLEPSQLLDLDQSGRLGPLFDLARNHLAECSLCRKAHLECEALKALAMEASLPVDKTLRRHSLQGARKIEVEERLVRESGTDVARTLLLEKPSPGITFKPGYLWILGIVAVAGIGYHILRLQSHPVQTAKLDLPFEFQGTPPPSGPSPLETPLATPGLSEAERSKDQALDREARRLLMADARAREETSMPVATAVKTATSVPTPIPTQPPPTPRPNPTPASPAWAATESASTVDLHSSEMPSPAEVDSNVELPAASLEIENPDFSPRHGPTAMLDLTLPEPGAVEIRVFDVNGKSVKLIEDGTLPSGKNQLGFPGEGDDGRTLPPGSYYVRVMTRWFSRVEPLQLEP